MKHYKDSNANIITQELQQLKKKKENNAHIPLLSISKRGSFRPAMNSYKSTYQKKIRIKRANEHKKKTVKNWFLQSIRI